MSEVLNAFTVDLEDWYQGLEIGPEAWDGFDDRLRVGSDRLLRLLDAASVQATFFVLGYAAERAPDLIRAPFFSITKQSEWAFDVLAECGIECDSSVFPVQNYRYGIADAPRWRYQVRPGLTEFPLSTYRLRGRNIPVGGGAYFRIYPYTLTRYALRAINDEGGAAVFYIHPWELDPDHPQLDLPRRISLTHYWNLAATERRLERLLADFRFASLGRVLGYDNGIH